MAIQVMIRSFRGIERADIDVDPLALIAGKNYQGKSSICQAAAAALSGIPIPFLKPGSSPDDLNTMIPKKSAGALVRTGHGKGGALVRADEDNYAGVNWPDADFQSQGVAPQASAYATGLVTIMDIDPKHRMGFFSDLLGATPTIEDLGNFLADRGIGSDARNEAIWNKIAENGWDVTWSQAKEHGAKQKGKWEQVSGEKYGSSKADGWIPDNWEGDLETASRDALEAALAGAKAGLEEVVGQAAISDAEMEKLQEKADAEIPDIDALAKTRKEAEENHAAARGTLDNLPVYDESGRPPTVACAHCGEENELIGGPGNHALRKPGKKPSAAKLKKMEEDRDAAQDLANEAHTLFTEADRALKDAVNLKEAKEAAVVALEDASGKTSSSEEVDAAREAVRVAEERIAKFDAWSNAGKIHASIAGNQHIVDALAPEGVRKLKLIRSIGFLNEELQEICRQASWPQVRVDENMEASLNSREYILLSHSERYMVNTALQIATAKLDGSNIVIIDNIDILDQDGRNGLMEMVMAREIKAILAITLSNSAKVPNLAKLGVGTTYWVEDGICVDQPASAK